VVVEAVDRGGGVDEVRLYHNGKALSGGARDISVKGKGRGAPRSFEVALTPGENRLRAVALSRDRIEGHPHEIVVRFQGAARTATLHLLAVGINQYKNPALSLNYARPDAEGLSSFYRLQPARLFKEVRAHELLDKAATKEALLAKFVELEGTAPEDVVVIYLAGHGDALGTSWYFIPHEVVYPEREEEVRAKGLSSK
jgi:hypothetical protein